MTQPKPSLIWTRSRDDWESDQVLLQQRPWEAALQWAHWPCLRSIALPVVPDETTAQLAKAAARDELVAIVTSPKGAAFAAADPVLGPLLARVSCAHTHGESTARLLQARGIVVNLHAQFRTAEQLTQHLLAHARAGQSFLVVSAKQAAFDSAAALRAGGVEASAVVCYETVAQLTHDDDIAADPDWIAARVRDTHGVVCFASPSAVQAFTAAFAAHPQWMRDKVQAMSIGPTTTKATQPHFAHVHTAPHNSLKALFEAALALLRP